MSSKLRQLHGKKNAGGRFSSPIQQRQVSPQQGWVRGSAETPREQQERPAAEKMPLPSKFNSLALGNLIKEILA